MERKLDDNFVTEEYYAYAKSLVISKRTLNTAWLEGYYEGLDEGYRIRIVLRSYDYHLSAATISSITDFSEEKVIQILKEHGKIK